MTILDIAKKAGVSTATVSRVINNGSVRPLTRDRVLKVIEKENFVPDSRGAYLRKMQTKKIGLVIPDISNPVYPENVKMMHNYLKERGYHLILGNTYGEVAEERDVLDMMARERVSGLIVSTCEGEDDEPLYHQFLGMLERGVKIVFIGKRRSSLPVDVLTVDNVKGMCSMTSYLLNTGRKRVGLLLGGKGLRATEERFEGYRKALANKGMRFDTEIVFQEGKYDIENGEKKGKLLIQKGVDAVACGNDLLAIGVLKAAEALGVNVPEELAVTGFDDIYLATIVRPSLTTVRQAIPGVMSAKGCEILLRRIEVEKSGEPEEIIFDPEIIIRESA